MLPDPPEGSTEKQNAKAFPAVFQLLGGQQYIADLDGEMGGFGHLALPIWQRQGYQMYCRMVNIDTAATTLVHLGMRRRPMQVAPEGFIRLVHAAMEQRRISLNQLAERADFSPAFLSRILNRERGLPSDKTILRMARVLDLAPPERLLVEAGRIPEELRPALSQPRMPELLRAAGELSETEFQDVLKTVNSLILKRQRRKRP